MSEKVVVVGAGGHAKVCIELLRSAGAEVAWCVGAGANGEQCCVGVPVLTGDDHIERLRREGYERIFIAVGSNSVRMRLGDLVDRLGYTLVNAVSPRATVSPSARIGRGVAIMAGAVVNAEAEIDDLSIVNTGATVDHDCSVGRGAHVAPQVGLAGNVRVGRGAFLGIGSRLVPGVSIGDNAVLGAGAVVIEDVPSGVTAVGIPARIIKHLP